MAGKGFASPTQFKGEDIKNALIRNWRNLTTFINTWVVTFDSDGNTLDLPGDLNVQGDLTVEGNNDPQYAGMYISTPTATVIAATTSHYKVLGTTTSALLSNFTMPANNRLTYTGVGTRVFHVDVALSTTTAAANVVVEWAIAKNGTVITGTEIQRKQTTAADVAAVALDFVVSLTLNDYIEVFVKNTTSATNVTATKMVVTIS